jgi:hypothetical protein
MTSKIMEYCEENMGKCVGRGECWDLVKYALDYSDAKWGLTSFGLNYGEQYTDQKYKPGDILKFENVVLEKRTPTSYMKWAATKHYVIIKSANDSKITVYHQNQNNKRYVVMSTFDLQYKTSGIVTCWHPTF